MMCGSPPNRMLMRFSASSECPPSVVQDRAPYRRTRVNPVAGCLWWWSASRLSMHLAPALNFSKVDWMQQKVVHVDLVEGWTCVSRQSVPHHPPSSAHKPPLMPPPRLPNFDRCHAGDKVRRLLLWLRRAVLCGHTDRPGANNHSVGRGLLP